MLGSPSQAHLNQLRTRRTDGSIISLMMCRSMRDARSTAEYSRNCRYSSVHDATAATTSGTRCRSRQSSHPFRTASPHTSQAARHVVRTALCLSADVVNFRSEVLAFLFDYEPNIIAC